MRFLLYAKKQNGYDYVRYAHRNHFLFMKYYGLIRRVGDVAPYTISIYFHQTQMGRRGRRPLRVKRSRLVLIKFSISHGGSKPPPYDFIAAVGVNQK